MDSGSFRPTSRDKSKSRAALPIYPAPLSIECQDSTPTQFLFKKVGGTYKEYHAHLAHVKSLIQTFTLNQFDDCCRFDDEENKFEIRQQCDLISLHYLREQRYACKPQHYSITVDKLAKVRFQLLSEYFYLGCLLGFWNLIQKYLSKIPLPGTRYLKLDFARQQILFKCLPTFNESFYDNNDFLIKVTSGNFFEELSGDTQCI